MEMSNAYIARFTKNFVCFAIPKFYKTLGTEFTVFTVMFGKNATCFSFYVSQ